MSGVVEDRSQAQVFRRLWQIQPGAAAAEFLFVREGPRFTEAENAQEGEADAGGFGVVKTFAQGVFSPEVQPGEPADRAPISDLMLGLDFGEEFDGVGFLRRRGEGDGGGG